MYNTEQIIALSNGLNPRYHFEEIRKRSSQKNIMINPITGNKVSRVKHENNVNPEDIEGAVILHGESNEYVTQYSNGLMVKHLKENDGNPYIDKLK